MSLKSSELLFDPEQPVGSDHFSAKSRGSRVSPMSFKTKNWAGDAPLSQEKAEPVKKVDTQEKKGLVSIIRGVLFGHK